MDPVAAIKNTVLNDLDTEFVESVSINAAWSYSLLFDRLALDENLTSDVRQEQFAEGRAAAMTSALVQAAKKHGVPYEFRKLPCNGQSKLMIRAGRVILIHETVETRFWDRPKAATFKRELSRYSGIVRQLELDLRDRPLPMDPADTILCVLLHGSSGIGFSRKSCELGLLMLGLPDSEYESWVMRLDLHDIAMFGNQKRPISEAPAAESIQEDRVHIKRRSNKRMTQ